MSHCQLEGWKRGEWKGGRKEEGRMEGWKNGRVEEREEWKGGRKEEGRMEEWRRVITKIRRSC